MKKRLLITSIVMMLVIAVALSTATYAWFTSNNQVKASSINVTAATNTASALAIGWTGGNAGTIIVANDPAAALVPMAPEHLVNDETDSTVTFYSATVKSENSVEVFNSDVSSTVQPYTFTNGTASSFYIKNLSQQNVVPNIRVTIDWGANAYEVTTDTTFQSATAYYKKDAATGAFILLSAKDGDQDTEYDYIAGTTTIASVSGTLGTIYVVSAKDDGSDLIRVGIFVKENGESSYVLKGVLAKATESPAPAHTATIANSTNATDGTLNIVSGSPSGDCAQVATSQEVLLLSSGVDLEANNSQLNKGASQVDIVVKVWYDGVTLDDTTAGSIANLGLIFDKVVDPV